MNKPVYLGFSISGLSQSEMYEFRHGYIRKKYNDYKLYNIDTDSFIITKKQKTFSKKSKKTLMKDLTHQGRLKSYFTMKDQFG